MRVKPSFSSEDGPSSTSMTSSMSAVRRILALPTSKSFVMAMDFVTTKYCCRNEQNLRLPTPPTSMCLHSSSATSGFRFKPSSDSRCLQKAASEMRSSPGSSSSEKSASFVRSRLRTSSRSAADVSPYLASTIAWHWFRTLSIVLLFFFARAAAFISIFCSSRFTSVKGPLTALPTFVSCSSRKALASAMLCVVASESFCASSKTAAGVAKESRSDPLMDTRGAHASSSCFATASMACVFVVISANTTSASFLSWISL
mmetsp:Transcript_70862/g.200793  ORF Transcript_70862/g.200793 Transcript_70862/m.200793 type:complete len:258 (+) Transcript_70862:1306-2079(+)